jgi:hypothetical protein
VAGLYLIQKFGEARTSSAVAIEDGCRHAWRLTPGRPYGE